MTDAVVTIDAGTLLASTEDRKVSGLLVPYGVEARSNLGAFTVDPGVFRIPEDVPNTVGLNIEHQREQSAGRAFTLTETPEGIVATYDVARGRVGDLLLAGIADGSRRHLSVEVANVRIGRRDDGTAYALGGDIFGSAVVAEPAFAGATLYAAAATDEPEDDDDADDADDDDADTADTQDSGQDMADVTPAADDAAADEGTDDTMTGTAVATAPDTLHAARVAAVVPDTSLARFNTLLANRQSLMGDPGYRAEVEQLDNAGATLFAALTDLKIGGTGAANTGIQVPAFIGELWTQVAYRRRIVPLMNTAALTSLVVQGWRWTTPPAVDTWAGNKSAVPSPATATQSYSVTADRLAGAYDVAREFIDFTVPGFWESFWAAMTASYAKKSDDKALADLVAAATDVASPAAVTGVNQTVADIIAGIEQVIQYGTPAFAVTDPASFASLATITNNGQFPYLSVGEVGFPVYGPQVSVAGIPVVPGAVGDGATLVAAREAATFYELPGSPIRVEGVYDMAKGGVNPGLFGYFATVIHQPAAIALVAPAVIP